VTAAELLREACGTRFTAAVLRVERGGRAILEEAFGRVDERPDAMPAGVTTSFDLASLTKPFIAAVALRAVAEGRIELDAPLCMWIGEWRATPHETITLRTVLAHTSGMQSGADYRVLLSENVEEFALSRELVAAPFERVIYSDLGFIALGILLARLYETSLARVVEDACAAFGATESRFRPRARDAAAIPATEFDAWRGRVRGAVHDEKAHLMNGVAGHAGLFGTARDVAVLAEAFLGPLHGRADAALAPATAREATIEQGGDPVLRRGLGWALKTSDENSCGANMSRSTFGHTGFTGTCVWADPVRDLSIVLLTNAVYFGRNDLRDLRAAVCDSIVAEVDRCARSA
jgi:CubicO group peptidase (beta-lactamase class C family)